MTLHHTHTTCARVLLSLATLCAMSCGPTSSGDPSEHTTIETVDLGAYAPPQQSPLKSYEAPAAPITIHIDTLGVPHVYAENDRDLFFGAGYQLASERLFSLDINRRAATGKLASILGAEAEQRDIQAFVLGFDRWAPHALTRMAKERPKDYDLLIAYVGGINRYVREIERGEHPLPEDFAKLGYTPEPITARDVMAIGYRIQFGYSNTLEPDLLNTILYKLKPQLAAKIPTFQPGDPTFTMRWGTDPLLGALTPPPAPVTPEPHAAPVEVPREELASLFDALHAFRHGLRLGEGSNAWSVHGDHTFNGRPIVANDSHAGLRKPNDLYLMHLNSMDAGGAFDVMGFGFIGIPGVQLGHNRQFAWAATTHFADLTDLWDVSLDKNSRTARLGGRNIHYNTIRYAYDVKLEDGALEARTFEVIEIPGQGVILPQELLPVPKLLLARGELMLGWPGWSPNAELFMFFDLDRARDLDDFTAAIELQHVGLQNWHGATAQGHRYHTHGTIPQRLVNGPGTHPNRVMDGDNADALWRHGFLPVSRQVKLDGSQPFLLSANNDPWGHTEDNDPTNDGFYYGSYYAPGYRAGSLYRALQAATKSGQPIDLEQMRTLQYEHKDVVIARLRPMLQSLRENVSTDSRLALWRDDAELLGALDALIAWDGTASLDSREALIYRVWLAHMSKAIFTALLGLDLFLAVDDAQPVTMVKLTHHILEQDLTELLPQARDLLVMEQLRTTLDLLTERQLKTWSDLHFSVYTSPIGEPTYAPTVGIDTAINVSQMHCWQQDGTLAERCEANAGPVFRTITTFDDDGVPHTEFNWANGNGPTTEDWLAGSFKPWYFKKEEVAAQLGSTITLE